MDEFARFLEKAIKGEVNTALLIRSTFVETVKTYWKEKSVFDPMLTALGPKLRAEVLSGPLKDLAL